MNSNLLFNLIFSNTFQAFPYALLAPGRLLVPLDAWEADDDSRSPLISTAIAEAIKKKKKPGRAAAPEALLTGNKCAWTCRIFTRSTVPMRL